MEELHKLDLTRLHHPEFGQFILRFIEDFTQSDLNKEDDTAFEEIYTALQDQLPTYNSALKQVKASEESKEIARLDDERDDALQTMRNAVNLYRTSKIAAELAAHNSLNLLLSQFKGAESESLVAETNELKNLTSRLQSADYSASIALLEIGKFVTRLADANTAFNDLFSQRSFKTSQKVVYDVKALRKSLTEDYIKMARYILSLANVKQDTYYKDILVIINNGRTYFSNVIVSRRKPKNPPELPAE